MASLTSWRREGAAVGVEPAAVSQAVERSSGESTGDRAAVVAVEVGAVTDFSTLLGVVTADRTATALASSTGAGAAPTTSILTASATPTTVGAGAAGAASGHAGAARSATTPLSRAGCVGATGSSTGPASGSSGIAAGTSTKETVGVDGAGLQSANPHRQESRQHDGAGQPLLFHYCLSSFLLLLSLNQCVEEHLGHSFVYNISLFLSTSLPCQK